MNQPEVNNPQDEGTVDTFYILDFDRCLGRTEKFQALLERIIEHWAVIDLGMIQYAHREVKKTGGSFDTAAYVRQVLVDRKMDGEKIWHDIEKAFVAAARHEDLFEPYACDLLEALNSRFAHYGILTYGGKDWQAAKLKASGLLSIPHLITTNQEKGRLIASWRQRGGGFLLPDELSGGKSVHAVQLVFIDDKPVSFMGIPAEVKGICVSPLGVGATTADMPSNVTVVQNMRQAEEALFGKDVSERPFPYDK